MGQRPGEAEQVPLNNGVLRGSGKGSFQLPGQRATCWLGLCVFSGLGTGHKGAVSVWVGQNLARKHPQARITP